jgi:hypothetical protein
MADIGLKRRFLALIPTTHVIMINMARNIFSLIKTIQKFSIALCLGATAQSNVYAQVPLGDHRAKEVADNIDPGQSLEEELIPKIISFDARYEEFLKADNKMVPLPEYALLDKGSVLIENILFQILPGTTYFFFDSAAEKRNTRANKAYNEFIRKRNDRFDRYLKQVANKGEFQTVSEFQANYARIVQHEAEKMKAQDPDKFIADLRKLIKPLTRHEKRVSGSREEIQLAASLIRVTEKFLDQNKKIEGLQKIYESQGGEGPYLDLMNAFYNLQRLNQLSQALAANLRQRP